jgi:hypothetical protein
MIGVDTEMRGWSFFQILEHNSIVNRVISNNVKKLAKGEEPTTEPEFDPKKDVLPSEFPGLEQVSSFRDSVETHLLMVEKLPPLRNTKERIHPIFGPFDAHKWHCMFGFHLSLHLSQASKVIELLRLKEKR